MDKGKALDQLKIQAPGQYSDSVTITPGYSKEFILELVSYSVNEEWSQPMAVGQVEEREPSLMINVSVRMKEATPVPEEEEKDGEATADAG